MISHATTRRFLVRALLWVAATIAGALLVVCTAREAQTQEAAPPSWRAAPGGEEQPFGSWPPRSTEPELPALPPVKTSPAPSPQSSPPLLQGEPLLEAMLFQRRDSGANGQTTAPRIPPSDGPLLQREETFGLLGEMFQQRGATAGQTVVRPRLNTQTRAPQPSQQQPPYDAAPANFQDDFDLLPPATDVPPLPGSDEVPPPPGTAIEDVAPPSATPEGDSNTLSPNRSPEEPTLGEAPEETDTYLQFLRTQTILLDPGEHQLDITFQYLLDTNDFTFAQLDENDELQVVTLRRRQRLILTPVELRYGISCHTQGFVNVPLGWAGDEVIFGTQQDNSDAVGIGDVSFGITEILAEGDAPLCPDILGTFAITAPTGDADLASSLAVPGSSLGAGFWGFTAALNFIYTYDPVVIYYGFGYTHRLDNTFAGGIDVNPGEIISYRLGVGFAINPYITLSSALSGAYITETKINQIVAPGSDLEPISLRFAATIAKDTCPGAGYSVKTVEPFANIGMTNEAIDSVIGVSWTR